MACHHCPLQWPPALRRPDKQQSADTDTISDLYRLWPVRGRQDKQGKQKERAYREHRLA